MLIVALLFLINSPFANCQLFKYFVTDKRFEADRDVLAVGNNLQWLYYNTTTGQLILSINRTKTGWYTVPVAGQAYYIYQSGKTIFNIHNTTGTLTSTYTPANSIGGGSFLGFSRDLVVTSNYAYLLQKNTNTNLYTMSILTRNMSTLVSSFVFNNKSSSVNNDDNGIYLPLSLGSSMYNLTKFDPLGNLVLNTPFPEACKKSGIYAGGSSRVICYFCENLLYFLNAATGSFIRRVATSSYPIKRMYVTETDVYAFVVNGKVFQYSLAGEFVALYQNSTYSSNGVGDIGFNLGVVTVQNNYVFFTVPTSNVPDSTFTNCASGLYVLQYPIKVSPDNTTFTYVPQTISPSSNISITNSLNTANFGYNISLVNRFSNANGELPQNSFFSPVLIPGNNSISSLVFFGGAGSVTNATCFDNYLHFIKLSSNLDPNDYVTRNSYSNLNPKKSLVWRTLNVKTMFMALKICIMQQRFMIMHQSWSLMVLYTTTLFTVVVYVI
jgi:hypothetical protein